MGRDKLDRGEGDVPLAVAANGDENVAVKRRIDNLGVGQIVEGEELGLVEGEERGDRRQSCVALMASVNKEGLAWVCVNLTVVICSVDVRLQATVRCIV